MAGDWIKSYRASLIGSRSLRMGRSLSLHPACAHGLALAVWHWAETQTVDGFVQGIQPEDIDQAIGFPGLAQSMVDVGWLVFSDEGVTLPEWEKHNGDGAKQRLLNSRRQQAYRARNADRDGDVTQERDERNAQLLQKRQLEKSREREERETDKAHVREEAVVTVQSKSPRRARTREAPPAPTFPAPWMQDPTFQAAWSEWTQHRREIKHSMTPLAATKALKRLEPWGLERAVKAIEHSIAGGWQSIHEPDPARATGTSGKPLQRAFSAANGLLERPDWQSVPFRRLDLED